MIYLNPEWVSHPEFLAMWREQMLKCVDAGLCTPEWVDEVMAVLSAGDPQVNQAFMWKLGAMLEAKSEGEN